MRPVASEALSATSASTLIAASPADAIPEPDVTEAELPAAATQAESEAVSEAVREAIAEPDSDADTATDEDTVEADTAPVPFADPEPASSEAEVIAEAIETAPEPQAAEPVAAEEPAPAQAEIPAPVVAPEPEVEMPVAAAVVQDGLAPIAQASAYRFSFTPVYFDVQGMGSILIAYMQSESAAAMSHMRALGEVRSPADMIRLHVTEMQRAADASLTCWMALARSASRPAALQ